MSLSYEEAVKKYKKTGSTLDEEEDPSRKSYEDVVKAYKKGTLNVAPTESNQTKDNVHGLDGKVSKQWMDRYQATNNLNSVKPKEEEKTTSNAVTHFNNPTDIRAAEGLAIDYLAGLYADHRSKKNEKEAPKDVDTSKVDPNLLNSKFSTTTTEPVNKLDASFKKEEANVPGPLFDSNLDNVDSSNLKSVNMTDKEYNERVYAEVENYDEETKSALNDIVTSQSTLNANPASTFGGYFSYGARKDALEGTINAAVEVLKAKGYTDHEIDKMAEKYERYANKVNRDEARANVETSLTDADFMTHANYNAASVGASLVAGFPAAAESAYDMLSGKRVDPNSPAFAAVNFQQDVSETEAKNIQKHFDEQYGDGSWQGLVATFGYNVAMATASSLASMATGGAAVEALGISGNMAKVVANIVTLPQFGSQAFSQTVAQGIDRGLSQDQIMKTAFVSGMAEMLTEVISLDYLWDVAKNSGKAATRSAVVNALVEAGIEGSEEVFNDIINEITDLIVNGDKAEFEDRINNYIANGHSDKDAVKMASSDFLFQVAEDFLAGTLSGAGSTMLVEGTATQISKAAQAKQNVDLGKEAANKPETLMKYVSDERTDYRNQSEYDQAQDTVLKAIDASGNKLSIKEKAELGKTVREALSNQNKVNSSTPAAFRTAKVTDEEAINAINEAKSPYELKKAEESLNEVTEEAKKAIASTEDKLKSVGFTEEEINAAVTAQTIYEKAVAGEEVSEDVLKNIPKEDKNKASLAVKKANDISFIRNTPNAAIDKTTSEQFIVASVNSEGQVVDTNGNVHSSYDLGPTTRAALSVALRSDLTEDEYKMLFEATKVNHTVTLPQMILATSMMLRDANLGVTSFEETKSKIQSVLEDKKVGTYKFNLDVYKPLFESMKEKASTADTRKEKGNVKKSEGKVDKAVKEALMRQNEGLYYLTEALAKKFSLDVTTIASGRADINFEEGQVGINLKKADDAFASLLHEFIGENLQKNNAKEFRSIQDDILRYLKATLPSDQLDNIIYKYQRVYREGAQAGSIDFNKSYREAANEMVNDVIYMLFQSEEGLNDLVTWASNDMEVEERKTFLERMQSLFDKFIAYIKNYIKNRNLSAAERAVYEMSADKASELRARILKALDNMTETSVQSEEELLDMARHSFAGVDSDTAELGSYYEALHMEEAGIEESVIFETTGWFKGMDNQWKYEIPDNDAVLFKSGNQELLKQNKDYARYLELLDKVFFNYDLNYSEEEYNELVDLEDKLPDDIARYNAFSGVLSDFLKHDELYKAYPQLKNMPVEFIDMPDNTRGHYNAMLNTIALNKKFKSTVSYGSENSLKSTLLHEIQHAIQDIEGFASGASSEYWDEVKGTKLEKDLKDIQSLKFGLEKRMDAARRANKPASTAEWIEASMAKVANDAIEYSLDDHFEELNKWKRFSGIYSFENRIQKLERHVLRLSTDSSDLLYWNTAGEIEARDVQQRMNLSSEERKENFPKLDAKDVVYSTGDVDKRRFSHDIEQKAIEHFGTTEDFKVAGYLLTDGQMLDFSGVHWLEGYDDAYIKDWKKKNDIRQVDHEDIYEVMEASGDNRKQFMDRGNIRLVPEAAGINISTKVEPTSAQYRMLKEFIREVNRNPRYNNERFFVDLEGDKPNKITYEGVINEDKIVNDIKSFFETGEMPKQSSVAQFRYSLEVPTFYSKLTNEIEGIKQNKIGAASVVNYLKGKGVKDEEIKWSGIETFLEGKKSVTKEELLEFARANELQINETTRTTDIYESFYNEMSNILGDISWEEYAFDYDGDFSPEALSEYLSDLVYDEEITGDQLNAGQELINKYKNENVGTKWHEYVTDETTNYREILFKLPGSDYKNNAMQVHWGERGVIAHARIDDIKLPDGSKMLFVEEIQSDWHNRGSKSGYVGQKEKEILKKLQSEENKAFYDLNDYQNKIGAIREDYSDVALSGEEGWSKYNSYKDAKKNVEEYKLALMEMVPDAPFRDSYQDYVMKRLLRVAAEGNYDYIGWTTGKMQEERWSNEYAEGYRIEYDQQIPKFMNKYGKQWGVQVEKIGINEVEASDFDVTLAYDYALNNHIVESRDDVEDIDINDDGTFTVNHYNSSGILEHTTIDIPESVVQDQVWAVAINDAMKESVLTKGQARFSLDISTMKNLSEEDKENYKFFKHQINLLEKGFFDKNPDSMLVMKHTPIMLQLIGLDDQPIYTSASHMKKAMKPYDEKKHQHGLTKQDMYEVPILLSNPMMIADSINPKRPTSIVIISDSKDFRGENIIISLQTDGEGRLNFNPIDSNFLTGVYGKNNTFNFLDSIGKAGAMLFMDKKKTQALLSGRQHSLPSSLTNLVFDEIIKPSNNIVNRKSLDVDFDSVTETHTPVRVASPTVAFTGTDEEIEQAEAEDIAFKTFFSKLIHSKDFIGLQYAIEKEIKGKKVTRLRFLTPSVREGVDWQLSYMTNGIPEMHEDYNDVEDVVDRAVSPYSKTLAGLYQTLSHDIPDEGVDVKVIRKSSERKSLEVLGEASPYYDTIMEADTMSAVLSAINTRLKGTKFSSKTLERTYEGIFKKYGVESANIQEEVAFDMMRVFDYMTDNEAVDYTVVMDYLMQIGHQVIENSNMEDPKQKQIFDEMKKTLSSYKIKLTTTEKKELTHHYGGKLIAAYGNMNKYGIKTTNDGQTLDGALFEQICDDFLKIAGVRIDPNIPDGDQMITIIETMEALKPSKASWEGATDAELSLMVAADVIEGVYKQAADLIAKEANKEAVRKEVLKETAKLRRQFETFKDEKERAYRENVYKYMQRIKEQEERLKGWGGPSTMTYNEVVATAKAEAKKRINSMKESEGKAKHKDQIIRTCTRLINWMKNPTDNQHVPNFLKEPITDVINAIDFMPESLKKDMNAQTKTAVNWQTSMRRLQKVIEDIKNAGNSNDIGDDAVRQQMYSLSLVMEAENLFSEIDKFITDNSGIVVLSNLDADAMKELARFMAAISAAVNKMNSTYKNRRFEKMDDLGKTSITEMNSLKPVFNETKNPFKPFMHNFLNLSMLEPITFFEELGDAAESVMQEFFDGEKLGIQIIRESEDFFNDLHKRLGLTAKDTRKWSEETHEFKIASNSITLTTSDIMSLYASYKQETIAQQEDPDRATYHIVAGGIKASKKKIGNRTINFNPVVLHPGTGTIEMIIHTLDAKQIEYIDSVVDYMSKNLAMRGNETSFEMYGYEKFNGSYYFPLKTDQDTIQTNESNAATAQASLRNLVNPSFTKARLNVADNPLVIMDFFDVVTDHIMGMANYCAYAQPVSDALRWYNYSSTEREQIDNNQWRRTTISTKTSMKRVKGSRAANYFETLIRDINLDNNTRNSAIQEKLISMYKAQAVAGNLRVVIQQPAAIVRALDVIDAKYLIKGISYVVSHPARAVKQAQKKSYLCYWKSKGFSDQRIAQNMKEIIVGHASIKDDIVEKTGALAGLADDVTWAAMYKAAEYQVKDENKNLDPDEMINRVDDVFSNIINHTQVIDSTLRKTEENRNKVNGLVKIANAFQNEPQKTYNMLHRKLNRFYQKNNEATKKALKKTLVIYSLSAFITGIAQSIADALRDDSDDKLLDKFLRAMFPVEAVDTITSELESEEGFSSATLITVYGQLGNFLDNLNPINLLPYFSEISNIAKGYDSTRMDTQLFTTIGDTIEKINSKSTTDYGKVQAIAKVISMATGVPVSNIIREFKVLNNNFSDLWNGEKWYTSETTKNKAIKGRLEKALDEAVSTSSYDGIVKAAEDIYSKKLQDQLDKGKTEEDAKKAAKTAAATQVTNLYKEEYLKLLKEDRKKALNLKQALLIIYKRFGYTEKAAQDKINNWSK